MVCSNKSQYESAWSRATSPAQKLRTRLHGSANLLGPFPEHHRPGGVRT
jgi:hypothetical protein